MDEVNHPSHYTFGKIEVIDVLADWFPDEPLLWQVGKYIARAKHKGNMLQDLQKARFYLDRRIAQITEGTTVTNTANFLYNNEEVKDDNT